MSEIRDRIRKEIRVAIGRSRNNPKEFVRDKEGFIRPMYDDIADEILSIPELAIVDRKAEPPIRFLHPDDTPNVSYSLAQQDMLKAGWVKEV